ncbi:MAG: hypothetical protein ABI085_00125 [Gemmatimonadaceae bacterium]
MESPRAAPSGSRASAVTRALCLLVMVLMVAAALYGGSMALRYYHQIGV